MNAFSSVRTSGMPSSHLPAYQMIATKITSRTIAARHPAAAFAGALAVDAVAGGGRCTDVDLAGRAGR